MELSSNDFPDTVRQDRCSHPCDEWCKSCMDYTKRKSKFNR